MANYSAADIKQLRQETSCRMEDVKRALDLFEGDLYKSRAWLLENGTAARCRCGNEDGRPASMSTEYEYGVRWNKASLGDAEYNPHRWGMTKDEAVDWVRTWEEDFRTEGATFKPGLFSVIRRPIGEWEDYEY